MSSYLSLLLQRRPAEAVQAAEVLVGKAKARDFVLSQASERAYVSFKVALDERMAALKIAGELMQSVQPATPDSLAQVETQRSSLVNVVKLLRSLQDLDESAMTARDWQIFGRATGYCGLLSRCSTQIYPLLARHNALVMQMPKLSLLIQRDLNPLGPSGPLESEGDFRASQFKDYAVKKTKGVDDWLTGIVRLASDTNDRNIIEKCVEALASDDLDVILVSNKKQTELASVLTRALKRL